MAPVTGVVHRLVQHDATARAEYAPDVAQRRRNVREVMRRAVADHAVVAGIAERQASGVAHAHVDGGGRAGGAHRVQRQVEAVVGRRRVPGQPGEEMPDAAAEVEDAHVRRHLQRRGDARVLVVEHLACAGARVRRLLQAATEIVLPRALVRRDVRARRAHAGPPRSRGPTRPASRAGTPATTVSGATSRVTTAPAATTARSPTVTPGRIRHPAPR